MKIYTYNVLYCTDCVSLLANYYIRIGANMTVFPVHSQTHWFLYSTAWVQATALVTIVSRRVHRWSFSAKKSHKFSKVLFYRSVPQSTVHCTVKWIFAEVFQTRKQSYSYVLLGSPDDFKEGRLRDCANASLNFGSTTISIKLLFTIIRIFWAEWVLLRCDASALHRAAAKQHSFCSNLIVTTDCFFILHNL